MATDYTRREVQTIRDAYSALAYLAECSSWSNPPRLSDALRYETKQRSSQLVAKALMVREAMGGVRAARGVSGYVTVTPAELWDLSTGLAVAHMFGASIANMQPRAGLVDAFLAAADAADAAHRAAIGRAWEAV